MDTDRSDHLAVKAPPQVMRDVVLASSQIASGLQALDEAVEELVKRLAPVLKADDKPRAVGGDREDSSTPLASDLLAYAGRAYAIRDNVMVALDRLQV